MADIKNQKLLCHLTALRNIRGIFDEGLKLRAQLNDFNDVADQEIIEKRKRLALENYVPFHWFSKNLFDGGVQSAHKNRRFVLITVHRNFAERHNWQIIPRHPLANDDIELLDFSNGFKAIDWETMNKRDDTIQFAKAFVWQSVYPRGPLLSMLFIKFMCPVLKSKKRCWPLRPNRSWLLTWSSTNACS